MKTLLHNFNGLSPAIKASISFFIASIVASGISYLTMPIYTRLLTTTEYGQTAVFLTWTQVFGIIAMFSLSYGVFNNGMIDNPNNRDEYSFSMLILSNIITLIFSFLLFLLYPIIDSYLKIDSPLLILMCVIFYFQPAYKFWTARQRYEFKYRKVLFWSIVVGIMSPIVAVSLILLSQPGERLYARIFGAEIVLIIIYIGFYMYIGFQNKWKVTTKYWKQALLFNIPLIPHYLSSYLLNSSDKLMISYLVDDNATALYSVSYSIAAIGLIIWAAINSSLVPYTYEKCKENDFRSINRVTLPLISLVAIGCVGIIMLAPEIIKIMATTEYLEAIYVIPPIVGGVFFQVQYFIYANIVYYYKKPAYVMIGSITAVVLNITLNYFFIKEWGYIAAGYTTLFCFSIQALIDYYAMRRVVGKNVYNMKYIFTISLFIVFIALFSNLLYELLIIRYVILGIMLTALISYRKKIISFLRFS